MHSFSDEALNRIRSPLQALADLRAKQANMGSNHPEWWKLAEMIERLAAEIAGREGRGGYFGSAAMALVPSGVSPVRMGHRSGVGG